jgi:hypothetical protein
MELLSTSPIWEISGAAAPQVASVAAIRRGMVTMRAREWLVGVIV